jgi:hypothetical protein
MKNFRSKNHENHSFLWGRISREKHLSVSRFFTSLRSSSRLSLYISSSPINVFSRNFILGTLWKSVERLQIWLKSGKKYISFYMKTFMLTAVIRKPILTSLRQGLKFLYCLQLRVNNNTKEIILTFPLHKIFPRTYHFVTLCARCPSCL